MEIQLKRISHDADKFDVRKAVELVLHGPDLYDPNDKENKGRKPNFEIVMGESYARRLHDGTAILRVGTKLGRRLLQWNYELAKQNDKRNDKQNEKPDEKQDKKQGILVCGEPLRLFNAHNRVPFDVKQTLEKARYIDADHDRKHEQKKDYCSQIYPRVAKIQIGVWYREPPRPNGPQAQTPRRAFSIEYEREFLRQSAAYITVVYEHSYISIEVSAPL
jgi:RNA-dependent RNA polymerase